MFVEDKVYRILTRGKDTTELSVRRQFADADIQDCLNAAYDTGVTAEACMIQSLRGVMTPQNYFVYEKLTDAETRPQYIDACEVYSGPNHPEFQNCKDDSQGNNQCNIPSFVWSGRSSNKVPVANFHAYVDPDPVSSTLSLHEEVSREMVALIRQVRENFSTQGLDAVLFSTEGDALHQLMDCMFMGPFASVDYGARGLRKDLPVPWYSRR